MPFRIYCDNEVDDDGKKCRREMEPVIDKKTHIVYCTECGKPLKNQDALSIFAKNQMLAMGQVRREEKKKQAFAVKCVPCDIEQQPILGKDGKKLLCPRCKQELTNLSPPFAQMLRQNITSLKKAGQK